VQNYLNMPAELEIDPPSETSAPVEPWHAEVSQLLSHAAELCVKHGVDVDHFLKIAWSAYVESRPGMREHLEELQLREQFDMLRKLGRLATA